MKNRLREFILRGLSARMRSRISLIKSYPAYAGKALPDTYFWSRAYDRLSRLFNRQEYVHRRRLAKKLEFGLTTRIDPLAGYAVLELSDDPLLQSAIDYSLDLLERLDLQNLLGNAQKSFLVDHELDLQNGQHEAIRKLAVGPSLLSPISEYLDCVPVLSYAAIWYSPNTHFEEGRSQQYHLDGDGYRNVTAFLPLRPVTIDSGPTTILPADLSRGIYNKLRRSGVVNRRNQKLDDTTVLGKTGTPVTAQIPMICNPGQAALVDTDHCYHFGSRPAGSPRYMLYLLYTGAFSWTLPFWGRRSNLESQGASDDGLEQDCLDSVIGLSHLGFHRMTKRVKALRKAEKESSKGNAH